jgi:hypothetical protein
MVILVLAKRVKYLLSLLLLLTWLLVSGGATSVTVKDSKVKVTIGSL